MRQEKDGWFLCRSVRSVTDFLALANTPPVHEDPDPRSCGRLAARTGDWGGRRRRRRKGPNAIHGEPLVLAAVFRIYPSPCFLWKGLAPERYQGNQGCLDISQGLSPPVLIPWLARVGCSGHPDVIILKGREAPIRWGGVGSGSRRIHEFFYKSWVSFTKVLNGVPSAIQALLKKNCM